MAKKVSIKSPADIEMARKAGAMAAELGLPVKTARRAGLLHDLGKAIDQEVEGAHAVIGAGVARKLGEPPRVCHAIEAHHGDVPATDVMDHIVDAANVLSSQRPGARREMLESYVQRLADLERIATSFAGVERAFALFPRLKERAGQVAGTLSGGEQQMLAMGRALMTSPRSLLLDEPSMGLAPNLVEQIFETIQAVHAQGTAILLVEQNANQALAIADRGYVIQTGQIVLADDAAALAANEDVRRSYLGEI